MSYTVTHTDELAFLGRVYQTEAAAIRAARRNFTGLGQVATVMWCDDTGKPKLAVARVHYSAVGLQWSTRLERVTQD